MEIFVWESFLINFLLFSELFVINDSIVFAAADITTTFPCNGKFTDKQKIIYNAVLAANREVFKAAKPGKFYLYAKMQKKWNFCS